VNRTIKTPIRTILISSLLLSTAVVQADWKQDMKDAATQKGNSAVAEKLNLPTTAPAGAKVYIISPKNGDTVSNPVVVQFGLTGAGVAPAGTQVDGTGHHHLLVDDPTIDATLPLPSTDQIKHFGKGQTETTLTLKPSKHTLQLLFADWKHQPFNPSVASDKITITVK
jgi:hypothetical protein